MEFDGLTGIIKFDEDGLRSEFELEVLEIMTHGVVKVCFNILLLLVAHDHLNFFLYIFR